MALLRGALDGRPVAKKIQTPRSKIQRSPKLQTPNRGRHVATWSLGFGISLVLGAWDLVFHRKRHPFSVARGARRARELQTSRDHLLPQLHNQILALNRVADLGVEGVHHAVDRGVDRGLHLHRFHHQELVALGHLLADADGDADDEARDRSADVLHVAEVGLGTQRSAMAASRVMPLSS